MCQGDCGFVFQIEGVGILSPAPFIEQGNFPCPSVNYFYLCLDLYPTLPMGHRARDSS